VFTVIRDTAFKISFPFDIYLDAFEKTYISRFYTKQS